MIKYFVILFHFVLSYSILSGQNLQNTLIIKVDPQFSNKCKKSSISLPFFDEINTGNQVLSIQKKFHHHKTLNKSKAKPGEVDLSTIYTLKFSQEVNIDKVITQLQKNDKIQYVEKPVINQLIYSPSDTLNHEQWYLSQVRAFDAWDIEKGDTNVVIAITDTGIDTTHADLVPNMFINYDDPVNGIDDDNDGYIDNYKGWNSVQENNMIAANFQAHGAQVAGIASAATDNITGISGCGFNSKILTVKIDGIVNNQLGLWGAYEAIIYAADMGADIINCSWGSYIYSQYNQDLINYATVNKGALIIAGAGNDAVEDEFYPAAYDNVMAIGSTLPGDTIKDNSNFGYWLDIFAPGEGMYTTNIQGSYGWTGGTSMAAPVVAGAAALVKSQFPSYTAKQIEHQLKNSADNIEGVNAPSYLSKLGNGRVNFLKALTQTNLPGISFESVSISDNNDNLFSAGDTIRISGTFKNYLSSTTNVEIAVKSVGANLSALDANYSIGSINTAESINNFQDPFEFIIPSGLNQDAPVELLVEIIAPNYYTKEFLRFTVNNSFITVNDNKLKLTLTSDAGVGKSGSSPNLGSGIMLESDNVSLLYEGGFVLGIDNSEVLDQFRDSIFNNNYQIDNDFIAFDLVSLSNSPLSANFEYTSSFRERTQNPRVNVHKRVFLYNALGKDQSAIYTYTIRNSSSTTLNNLYAGLFMDWDIVNYNQNKVSYDSSRKMGISYSTDSSLFCGLKVLNTKQEYFHYAIDNINNGNGGVDPWGVDGFTTPKKLTVLSSNRHTAGNSSPLGSDILDAVSVHINSLQADSSVTVAFAVIIDTSISSLNNEADSIQQIYNDEIADLNTINIEDPSTTQTKLILYPNPTSSKLNVEFQSTKSEKVTLRIQDVTGKTVIQTKEYQTLSSGRQHLEFNIESLKTGVYFFSIIGDNTKIQDKFVVSP